MIKDNELDRERQKKNGYIGFFLIKSIDEELDCLS